LLYDTHPRGTKRRTVPAELGLDEAPGVQRLGGLDDMEVGYVELHVLLSVEVLLSDQDTFYSRKPSAT
jgi:hypothetical protein